MEAEVAFRYDDDDERILLLPPNAVVVEKQFISLELLSDEALFMSLLLVCGGVFMM